MKRLFSIVCLITLMASTLLLVGCSCNGCNSDVPPDHQLASIPEVDGYTLYIPEEWKFTRTNGVITAHVSSVHTTAFTAARVDTTHTDMNAYWQESEAELISMLEKNPVDAANPNAVPTTSYKLEDSGTRTLKAEQGGNLAYFYEYTGVFPTKMVRYRVLQYFILMGATPKDGMVVLTLSASDEPKANGSMDFNQDMRDKLMKMLDAIIIGKPGANEANKDLSVPDENAPDGMKNATANEHIGMTVYVPSDWRVTDSDGFIGAVGPDGHANIGITNLLVTGGVGVQGSVADRMKYYGIELFDEALGYTLIDYWNLTKAEYAAYFDEGSFTVLHEPKMVEQVNDKGEMYYTADPPPVTAGETSYYTYRFNGTYRGELYEVSFYVFRATEDRQNQFRTLSLMTHGATHTDYTSVAERILAEVRY